MVGPRHDRILTPDWLGPRQDRILTPDWLDPRQDRILTSDWLYSDFLSLLTKPGENDMEYNCMGKYMHARDPLSQNFQTKIVFEGNDS